MAKLVLIVIRVEEQMSGDLQVIRERWEETLMQLKAAEKACNVTGAAVTDTWRKIAERRCQTKETLKEERRQRIGVLDMRFGGT